MTIGMQVHQQAVLLLQREGAIHSRPADYFICCIRQAAIT
jgi:hypothetical protein